MKVGQTIYLDHQATTPVDPRVVAEMAPYFEDSFGNPHSKDHSIGWTASLAVDMSSDRIAALIGADKDEIIFTSGATESNNLALLGLCRKNTDKKRHRVLLSAIEHKSVLAVGRVLETQLGYDVQLLPVDRSGCVEMATLEAALDDHVLVVSIMAVNNEIGTIQDLESLARTIRDAGAFLHCDAAQTPLAIDLALFADGIDMMSLSSHKMGGPKGVGALYVRRDLQKEIEPLIYGGGQQNGLRSGTVPVALCVGMGAASSLCKSSEAAHERRQIARIRDSFVDSLMELPWEIGLNGPEKSIRHPGNASISFKGFLAHDILGTLQPYLAASTGSACSSGIEEPSHVLTAIGLSDEDAAASIRFSIGRKTTEGNMQEAVSLIKDTLEKLGGRK